MSGTVPSLTHILSRVSVPTTHRYLKLARECMKHVRNITSGRVSTSLQFNHGQCEYLVGKLKVAVQTADDWAQLNSSEFNSEDHEIMKILWRSAREIESFVQGCCKEEWIEAAMVLANMSAYVSSLGYNLELCTFLLESRINGGFPALYAALYATEAEDYIEEELDALRLRANEAVKKGVSPDQRTLLRRLLSLIHSSNGSIQGSTELAKCLAGRLSQHLSESVQLSVWKIDFSSLKQMQRLGSGAMGMVHQSIWLTGRIEVAEKVFYGSDPPSFDNEVQILAGLAHPNITPLLGYATDDSSCSIVMELMDCDLLFLMGARVRERLLENSTWKFPFTTPEAVDIMLQTAEGMLYLHEKRVVHGDLKSQNILVKSRKDIDVEYVFVKVADFGISKTRESSSTCSTQTPNTGTTRWMAPELMTLGPSELRAKTSDHDRKRRYPFKADIYSFGMVCYEILTGKVPFYTISVPREVRRMVLNGERPILPDHCPSELQILIRSCWEEEATSRPSFVEICKTLRRLKWLPVVGTSNSSQNYFPSAHVVGGTLLCYGIEKQQFSRIQCFRNYARCPDGLLASLLQVSNLDHRQSLLRLGTEFVPHRSLRLMKRIVLLRVSLWMMAQLSYRPPRLVSKPLWLRFRPFRLNL
jgi:serine/threonine protein kinase